MRAAVFILASLLAAPAHAQFGSILNKAQKAKDTADKVADLNITEQEERKLGENVSTSLRDKFGVYQDADSPLRAKTAAKSKQVERRIGPSRELQCEAVVQHREPEDVDRDAETIERPP